MTPAGFLPFTIGLTAVAVPLYLVADHRVHFPGRVMLKSLASLGFVGTALASGATGSPFGLLILAGLILSLTGDLFLISRARPLFKAGLVSFLVGHVMFSAAFLVRGQEWLPILAGMAFLIPIGIKVFFWLRFRAPQEMINAILAYIVVITTMAAFAIGAVAAGAPWLLIPGAVAFYCSDLAVARDRFVSAGFINRAWGLPLYYLGQTLIALSAGG
ncbi:lysoplasmalogenase family protein [Gemmatimonadota bacterium]